MIVNIDIGSKNETEKIEFEVDIPQKYMQRKMLIDFIKDVVRSEIKGEHSNEYSDFILTASKDEVAKAGQDTFYVLLNKYIENINLLKAAKNVHERDPRYFDFYDSVSVEDLDDKIQNYQYLSQGRSLGNKFLKGYAHLMYDIVDGAKVLDKGVASAMADLKIYLDAAKDNDDLTYRMEKIDREMMSKIKGWDRENLMQAINKITQDRYDLHSVREQLEGRENDAEIIWSSDNDERFAISVYSYRGSSENGALKWCISTDDDYFNQYYYMYDELFFPKIQVMIRLSDYNNTMQDEYDHKVLNPLREIGITFNLDGSVSDAFDADDNSLSRQYIEKVIGVDELNSIYENALKKYHPLSDVKNRLSTYLEYDFLDVNIQRDVINSGSSYLMLVFNYIQNECNGTFFPNERLFDEMIDDHKFFGEKCLVKDDEILDVIIETLLSIASEVNNEALEEIQELIDNGVLDYENIEDISEEDVEYIYNEFQISFSNIKWESIFSSDTGDIYENSSEKNRLKFDNLFIKNKTYLSKSISELEDLSAKTFWSHRSSGINFKQKGFGYSALMASLVNNYEHVMKENMSKEASNYLINTTIANSKNKLSDGIVSSFIENISLKKNVNINDVLELVLNSENRENQIKILKKIPDNIMDKDNISSKNILRLLRDEELQNIIGFNKMKESCKAISLSGDFNTNKINAENNRVAKERLPDNGYIRGEFVKTLKLMVKKRLIDNEDLKELNKTSTLSFGDKKDLSKYIDVLDNYNVDERKKKVLKV